MVLPMNTLVEPPSFHVPMHRIAYLDPSDADEGVEVDESLCVARCDASDAWLGLRGRPGVLKGGSHKTSP